MTWFLPAIIRPAIIRPAITGMSRTPEIQIPERAEASGQAGTAGGTETRALTSNVDLDR